MFPFKLWFSSALLIMTAEFAIAQGSWLCTGDDATGFVARDGSWSVSRFKPDKKYIVRPLPEEFHKYLSERQMQLRYGAQEFGKAGPAYCEINRPWSKTWVCGGDFYFNSDTLRFMHFFFGGYVDGGKNTDTPNIEIGTCVKLD